MQDRKRVTAFASFIQPYEVCNPIGEVLPDFEGQLDYLTSVSLLERSVNYNLIRYIDLLTSPVQALSMRVRLDITERCYEMSCLKTLWHAQTCPSAVTEHPGTQSESEGCENWFP